MYVLDAKYYKYGSTKQPGDLPESTSINKQITYGEYIANNSKFIDKLGNGFAVYNAFLIPFDKVQWKTSNNFLFVGETTSDWKDNDRSYERIKAILIDAKWLMKAGLHYNQQAVTELSQNC